MNSGNWTFLQSAVKHLMVYWWTVAFLHGKFRLQHFWDMIFFSPKKWLLGKHCSIHLCKWSTNILAELLKSTHFLGDFCAILTHLNEQTFAEPDEFRLFSICTNNQLFNLLCLQGLKADIYVEQLPGDVSWMPIEQSWNLKFRDLNCVDNVN